MPYVSAGTVTEQPGALTRLLDVPNRIWQFIMFFFMTLIDPVAAKKASGMAAASGNRPKKPLGGMKNLRGGPGSGRNMPGG